MTMTNTQDENTIPKSGAAEVNGARLYYEQVGRGRPLVLLHAGIADCRTWDDQIDAFAREYRVIRYDLRGFGNSPMPPGAFSHRDDLAMLLHHLGVESAILCGASFGGRIATEFALEYPAMVDALVLVGSALGGYRMSDDLDAFEAEIEAAHQAGDYARAAEIDLRVWVDGPHRTSDQVDPLVRERARIMAERVYEVMSFDGMPQPMRPSAIEHLREIRVPALVIVGDLDQPDMLRIADLLADGIPGARKIVMPGTAHLPSLERPDEFNRIVLEFLRELPETRRGGIALRELGPDNWEECVNLELAEDQRSFLEPNAVSIAESRFHPWMLPLAIYSLRDDPSTGSGQAEMVGFVMYSQWPDPRLPRYWIHRFMIDRRHQGKGHGRAAMREVIRRMSELPGCDEIWIGYTRENVAARRFYASLGFVEQGEAPWGRGELIAKLEIDRSRS